MKKVILIGDSIRMGYQPFVRQELADCANVWGPEENGGTSANVLAHLDEWAISRPAEIIHLNCGLHDLGGAFDAADPGALLSQYRANLEEIFGRILDETGARLIWAATTPVNERWQHKNWGFDQIQAEGLAYNTASVEIARRKDILVNDLYSVVMDAGRDTLLQEDGIHFTESGYRVLGRAVARVIRRAMDAGKDGG